MASPSSIAQALVAAMLTLPITPALNATTCYAIAAPAYIEGQDQLVLQICPGAVTLGQSVGGRGAQEGGALFREVSLVIAVWYRLKLDLHGQSQQAMMLATKNLMSVCDAIRQVLALTYLRNEVTEPLWYSGESDTEVYDPDGGVYRRDIYFSGSWAAAMPRQLTYS